MRIHLVTPKNPPSFWTYDSILPTLGRRAIFPNLSMPTLAGLTPPHHDVTLCDENVEEIDFDVEADIVGVTGYIVHRERMLEIVDAFRARGRMVVVGGPFASLCPEALRGRADVVFIDEAEQTWPHFLEDLERGQWKSEYRADEKPDLALAPTPRFDLLKIERYHAITIQFARGCPFQCEFCDIIVLYGRKPRTKRPAQVMREIAECHRLGAKQVFIVDDNFIGDRKLAKALLREMAAWGEQHGWPMDFQTEVSLNVAQDEELLPLLRAARFTTLFIRIETPRKESPAATKKMQNMRGDLIESVHRIQAHGIQVQAGMIVGFDADDESIFDEQLAFLEQARLPVAMVGMLQALPQTALHARLAAEGRLVADSLGDQFVFSNIVPKRMSRLALYRGYRRLLLALYEPASFRRRALAFIVRKGDQRAQGYLRPGDLGSSGACCAIRCCAAVRSAAGSPVALRRGAAASTVAFQDAVSFAIVHRAFFDYMQALAAHLGSSQTELQGDDAEANSRVTSRHFETQRRRVCQSHDRFTFHRRRSAAATDRVRS